jgi:hypothetical protein
MGFKGQTASIPDRQDRVDDLTTDSERIGNTQLIVNDLPVLQVL